MTTQTNSSNHTYYNLFLFQVGSVCGGLLTVLILTLWVSYQLEPTQSLLGNLSQLAITYLPVSWQVVLQQQAAMMGLPLTSETPAYWYMARIGGIVAYLLLWLSNVWGIVMSSKFAKGFISAPFIYGMHEFLPALALVFTVLHSVILLGDSYINFNIFHLLIPFSSPYAPFWTGLGTISFYLLAAILMTSYLRKQVGQKMWRALHYVAYLCFVLALGHGIMAGSDSSSLMIQTMYWFTGLSVFFLTIFRVLTTSSAKAKR